MAVPASAENEEPPWPDLRNMEGQEGFYPYRMSEDLIGSYNRFSYTGRDELSYKARRAHFSRNPTEALAQGSSTPSVNGPHIISHAAPIVLLQLGLAGY